MGLKSLLRDAKREVVVKRNLLHDVFKYSKYYADAKRACSNGDLAARDILVYSHIVEKGLSHKNVKPLFGFDRISKVSSALNDYLKKGGTDNYIISVGVSSIKKYNEVNRALGVPEEKLISIPQGCVSAQEIEIGAYELSKKAFFAASQKPFSDLCQARHSVRLYDCKSDPVSYDVILQCIALAQNCPSACNRQGVQVKVVLDPDKIKAVADIQKGCSGFGENSAALLIVTSDLSMYKTSERKLPMIDCGIFIMNMVYALYAQNLGSCILNCELTPGQECALQKIVPVEKDEIYAAIISVSNIPESEKVLIAHSSKRDVDSIASKV